MIDENNGIGWTDAVISHINLVDGNKYTFEAQWHNDSDGMDQFWIIPGSASVPEPATLGLLSMGMLGFAAIRRKAKA